MSRRSIWLKELFAVLLVLIGLVMILDNLNPSTHLTVLVTPMVLLSMGGFMLIEHYSNHQKSTNWLSTFCGYLLCFLGLIILMQIVVSLDIGKYHSLLYLSAINISLFFAWIHHRSRLALFFLIVLVTVSFLDLLALIGYWKFVFPILLVVIGSYFFIKIPHKE